MVKFRSVDASSIESKAGLVRTTAAVKKPGFFDSILGATDYCTLEDIQNIRLANAIRAVNFFTKFKWLYEKKIEGTVRFEPLDLWHNKMYAIHERFLVHFDWSDAKILIFPSFVWVRVSRSVRKSHAVTRWDSNDSEMVAYYNGVSLYESRPNRTKVTVNHYQSVVHLYTSIQKYPVVEYNFGSRESTAAEFESIIMQGLAIQ